MRLARFRLDGVESLGLVDGEKIRRVGDGYQSVAAALGDPGAAARSAAASTSLPRSVVTLLAPVDGAARIFAAGDWFSAKGLDRSSPLGPSIASLNELDGDLADGLWCRLNDEAVQEDRTSSMVSSVARLISFISQKIALMPGDVLATGAPGGVGRARRIKLRDRDLVEVEVEGVGVLRNTVMAVE